MAWPTSPATPSEYDQGTDDPSLARSQILDLHTKLSSVIANRGQPSGVCDLDSNGKVPVARIDALPYGISAVNDLRGTLYSTGTPSDVYRSGTRFGFADASELGIPGAAAHTYGTLQVNGSWNDISGAAGISRVFVGLSDPRAYMQIAASDTAWGPWRELLTPQALVSDRSVIPFTFNAGWKDGAAINGPGNIVTIGYLTIAVPAGKALKVRRIRSYLSGASTNKRWRVTAQGHSTYIASQAEIDEDANTVLVPSSGSAVTATVYFAVDTTAGYPNVSGLDSCSGYLSLE